MDSDIAEKYASYVCTMDLHAISIYQHGDDLRPPYNSGEVEESGADVIEDHSDISTGMIRPFYGLFALPLFIDFT